MDGKKISFGFMKTKKVDKPAVEEKKEYIESVEGKSIRVLGGEEVKENTPLVIPMKPNTLVTAERLKEIAEKVESALEEAEPKEVPSPKEKPPENESLDQMAERELLENAKKEVKVETAQLTVPMPPKSIAEGEKESTLDDYESVPIQDFGLAMLRGMGWTPNNNNDKSKYKPPQLRPKGLGLGADKVVKDNQKHKVSKDNKDEELSIVKNAYVKITTGKFSGYYAKVISLDEDNGRVMVELAVKKETVSLSEFMMHPVTKSEYDKESKVINSTTFEEYKRNENSGEKSSIKSDRDKQSRAQDAKYSEKSNKYSEKESTSREQDERRERERERTNRDRSIQERDDRRERDRDTTNRDRNRDYNDDRHRRKKSSKKYSSNESLNSLSDSEKQRKDKKRYSSNESLSSVEERRYKKKDKKRYSSSDSESDRKKKSVKRDIDKKRKGKKKKRDRDRSPNYRKHRK